MAHARPDRPSADRAKGRRVRAGCAAVLDDGLSLGLPFGTLRRPVAPRRPYHVPRVIGAAIAEVTEQSRPSGPDRLPAALGPDEVAPPNETAPAARIRAGRGPDLTSACVAARAAPYDHASASRSGTARDAVGPPASAQPRLRSRLATLCGQVPKALGAALAATGSAR